MDPNQQQLLLGYGGKKEGTYIDDVFSTYLYKGTKPAAQSIVNGIKLGNANSGTSVLFDDAGDYLMIPFTTDLCLGSNDFTIECWAYYRGDFDSFDALFGNWGGSGSFGYVLETVGSGPTTDLEFYYYDDSNGFIGPVQGGTVSSNQWNHLCVCRSGNTIRLFVNGTMHGSGTSITTGIRNGSTEFTVGGRVAGSGWWNGYITDLRVTIGQALYTSNFTPSTDPLTTTSQGATASNVKLLCCNKDTATGSTKTPATITAHGENGPHIKSFGRFTATDGEGGLLWIKSRTNTYFHVLQDTVRGVGKVLKSNSADGNMNGPAYLGSFDNAGFSFNYDADNDVQNPNQNFASWSFRKQKGFFDIVEYTGTGNVYNVPHNLGSIPGCIMIKKTSSGDNWSVYHRGLDPDNPEQWWISLNLPNGRMGTSGTTWNNTKPTSTHFTIGSGDQNVNTPSATYIAYLFAGGMSTSAGAHSIFYDQYSGNIRRIRCGNSSNKTADFNFGTGDLTIECWIKCSDSQGDYPRIVAIGPGWANETNNLMWDHDENPNRVSFYCYNQSSSTTTPLLRSNIKGFNGDGHYHHVAVTRNGNTWRLFVDGLLEDIASWTGSPTTADSFCTIGNVENTATTGWFGGYISNVRIVKGTAVYTSSFRVPTEPLKNITNTKLLCCNNLSATAATVTPIALTEANVNQNQIDNPFDDPEGFQFGENADQNIIKCGAYEGNGGVQDIDIGFEAQWVLVRNIDNSSRNWIIADNMRGAANRPGSNDQKALFPNLTQDDTSGNYIGMYNRGFKLLGGESSSNQNGHTHIYIAIRRPDALVTKPVTVGNEVYTQIYGKNDNTTPTFVSNFVTDFTLFKNPTSGSSWYTQERLHGIGYMIPSAGTQEQDSANNTWDFMDGFYKATGNWTTDMNWMWKRGAGFDVVDWDGNGEVRQLPHGLGATPEFIIVKRRSAGEDWTCYHKGLNNGVNPSWYYIQLNSDAGEGQYTDYEPGNPGNFNMWNREEPTSTCFSIGKHDRVNTSGQSYMALLFTTIEGVSKVGYYQGQGSDQTIEFGFRPRFIMVKATDSGGGDWNVYDSTRGLVSGADKEICLNNNNAQSNHELGDVTSTGFTFACSATHNTCSPGKNFIYYAHA